jgi:hypothetical protein
MTLLLLEALGALVLLVFIVWWTMFSGRKKGELPAHAEQEKLHAPPVRAKPQDSEPPAP